jgi:hypothetical protein
MVLHQRPAAEERVLHRVDASARLANLALPVVRIYLTGYTTLYGLTARNRGD